ncbi:MAG: ArsC family transcriptional regulator [Oscillospiraceae bacterium]|jgi:arsenate reductase-like glutaredoxin family protein|nr:ArsC family transcriptional regulator [Oscillospiraceae bacterium]
MGIQIWAGKGFESQKALRFFQERRVQAQRVDLLRYGMGRRELESVLAVVGLDALVDRQGAAFAASAVRYSDRADLMLAALLEDPRLLKAPIVRDGPRRATVGYCPDVWKTWLAEDQTG